MATYFTDTEDSRLPHSLLKSEQTNSECGPSDRISMRPGCIYTFNSSCPPGQGLMPGLSWVGGRQDCIVNARFIGK